VLEPQNAAWTLRKISTEDGFTLVEVMAASVLLSVLVLCLINGWAALDRLSFDVLLRQKAIFVLNGEMERASALYGKTSFGAGVSQGTAGYTASPGILNSGSRVTYATTASPVTFTVKTLSAFNAPAAPDTLVWLYGTQSPPLNYVWLDRSRGLLARLSWSSCDVTDLTSSACWVTGGKQKKSKNTATCYGYGGGSGVCDLITMFLDYPYVLVGGVPTPLVGGVASTGTAPTTLTLSTVVGRRE
jgi:prepilin-type N-terminal cleavage/methylation domain-containing protein